MEKMEVNELSDKINIKIIEILNKFSPKSSIGIFYPFKNEVNILPLTKKLKMKFLLPKVSSKEKPLKYFSYSHETHSLEKGFGGIMEPIGDKSLEPDIIITSCSAFNVEGYRVGYGGGFFDRTISIIKKKKNLKTILAAFEIQKTTIQFQEKFDEKVDYICTENKTYTT